MKIIVAPDSFKGCLSSTAAAAAMRKGVLAAVPDAETDIIPMADGGEGTLDAFVAADSGARRVEVETVDPLGRSIKSLYVVLGDGETAVVETSAAAGLTLLKKEELNPARATTYGAGTLVKHALDNGRRKIIVAAGGSATNDCGAGLAQALGVRFFRKNKSEIQRKMNGSLLGEVAAIDVGDLHEALLSASVTAACDVENPLLGKRGCAKVYSAQKGASPRMVDELESNMALFVETAEKATGKYVRDLPGAGAGGGLGAGLALFLRAEPRSGADIVMDAVSFDQRIKDADLILTGEGKIDEQTIYGKTIAAIARRAKARQTPVVAFGGILGKADNLYDSGVSSYFSICRKPASLEQSLAQASYNLQSTVERVVRLAARFGRV